MQFYRRCGAWDRSALLPCTHRMPALQHAVLALRSLCNTRQLPYAYCSMASSRARVKVICAEQIRSDRLLQQDRRIEI